MKAELNFMKCTDELPIKSGWYLVCLSEDEIDEPMIIEEAYFPVAGDTFTGFDEDDGAEWFDYNSDADWVPYPEYEVFAWAYKPFITAEMFNKR